LEGELVLMIMSGVEDGNERHYELVQGDGIWESGSWILTLGRHERNDIMIRYDSFISRFHGELILTNGKWTYKDLNSTNGSFYEDPTDFFNDIRFDGSISIAPRQLFRVGRTWICIG